MKEKAYHLSQTRTTFVEFSYISTWEGNAKMTFFDGERPFVAVSTYSVNVDDMKQLIKMMQSMINEIEGSNEDE